MKPGKKPITQRCENMHIKSHLIPRLLAIKLIDAAKAFLQLTHQICISLCFFQNILFSWFSKQKGVKSLQVSQLSLLLCTHRRPEPRIASIHVSQFSSLKQNKTCTRRRDKDTEEGREGSMSTARLKGQTQRVFVVHQWSLPLARML